VVSGQWSVVSELGAHIQWMVSNIKAEDNRDGLNLFHDF
jgi:hypothetical protein